MIISNSGQSNLVESSGVQTTSTFNIARTPHMFRMMSSGLYSDKIGAVLRETACNGMDAHVMFGTPERPIQVKMPTALDRSFYIKDWGPGLDDTETRELYTTYGWSSKQKRDDVTGAFGLGSKSPFAYTLENSEDSDGFSVESVKDGVKRIYTCYIGEDGAPAISRLYEGPAEANWQHGVKVTFPVQNKDIVEFHEKACEIFQWFKVLPEFLGLKGNVKVPKFRMMSDFFGMGGVLDGLVSANASIVMGNVRYPLNSVRLRDITPTAQALLGAGIHLWVPMGTVMMTPSREELEYTDRTRKGVTEWLEKAALNVAHAIREAVMVPEPTTWDWCRKIQTYAESLPFSVKTVLDKFLASAGMETSAIAEVMQSVRENYAELPRWVGDGIGGAKPKFLRDPLTGVMDYTSPDPSQDLRGHRAWVYFPDGSAKRGVKRKEILSGTLRATGDKREPVRIGFTARTKVFYCDGAHADARIKKAITSRELDNALLIVPCKGTESSFAKIVAERLTGEGAFEGLDVGGSSALGLPDEVLNNRLKRKLQLEKTPREFFADTHIRHLALAGDRLTEKTLGELPETDLYYLCGNLSKSASRTYFFNMLDGEKIGFENYKRQLISESMLQVTTALGLPLTGFVIVESEAKVRTLKMAEQGFKPLLPFLKTCLADKDNLAKIAAGFNRTPVVNLNNSWDAVDYGWLGILGRQMVMKTHFWQMLSLNLALQDVVRDVRAFVSSVEERKAETQKQPELQKALLILASKVNGLEIDTSQLLAEHSSVFVERFNAAYPMIAVLERVQMIALMTEKAPVAISLLSSMRTLEVAQATSKPGLPAILAGA